MKFVSTTDNKKVSGIKTILQNVDSDGGVFVPSSLPILDRTTLDNLVSLDFCERMAKVLSFFFDEFSFEELLLIVRRAYENFDEDPSIVKIEDNLYIHERWHGPTYSHKDLFCALYVEMLIACLEKEKGTKKIFLPTFMGNDISLVTTLKDRVNARVVALYQDGNIGDITKKILFFDGGENVDYYSIGASKIDISTKLNETLNDDEFKSIAKDIHIINYTYDNVVALVVSIACNISSYCDLVDSGEIALGEKINFATSNFSSVVAMYYAVKMGLPIAKIILGTNANSVLVDYVMQGEYNENRQAYRTMSPMLDSVDKCALKRLTFEMVDRDCKRLDSLFEDLHSAGGFEISPLPTYFEAGWADEEETRETIFTFFDLDDYILDSNSAVGASVYNDYSCDTEDDRVTIIESYENPYRFSVQVMSALSSKEKNEIRAFKKLEATTAMESPYELSSYEDENAMGGEVIDLVKIRKVILQGAKELANEE